MTFDLIFGVFPVEVGLLGALEVANRLKRLIKNNDRIFVAVAWGYNGPLAEKLFNDIKKLKSVTIGVSFCQTDPDLVDRMVGLKNVFIAESGVATFHPKIYYFETDQIAEAIVGSSNFTNGGLGKNWEACLYLKGRSDLPVFQQVRACLDSYRSLQKPVTAAMANTYRLQHRAAKALRKPKNPVLPGDSTMWPQFSSSMVKMDWDTYVAKVRSSRYHEIDKRQSLLRTCQRLFASAGSFGELSANEWKAIAGVIGEVQKLTSGLDEHDWGWFGSMKGAGDFANRIADQDPWLARAIDSIPKHGDVTEAHYEDFCRYFLRAFDKSSRTGGVPTATRLLAMKRPDTFVCVSKPNKTGIAKALDFSPSKLKLDTYWQLVTEPVRVSAWYNSERPTGEDGEIWDSRVAMLDAIYYAP